MNNINIKNLFDNTNTNNNDNNNKIILSVNNLVETRTFKNNLDDDYIINKIKYVNEHEKKKTNELYVTKYKECLKKINDAIDMNLYDIFYEVNDNFFGYKKYSSKECLEYIQKKLRNNKFEKYIYSQHHIFISWKNIIY